jgi:anaerobic ribonucleoside-triphosphate reductase activating protein
VWTQGCSIGCYGCFNPETHQPAGGRSWDPLELASYLADPEIDGLTVTGGEPFDQWSATLALLEAWRSLHQGSTLVLSGHTLQRVESQHAPTDVSRLKECVDVLIAGPYQRRRHLGAGLRGSDNKSVHFFSDRHSMHEIDAIPKTEILIRTDGSIVSTGVDPVWVRSP